MECLGSGEADDGGGRRLAWRLKVACTQGREAGGR